MVPIGFLDFVDKSSPHSSRVSGIDWLVKGWVKDDGNADADNPFTFRLFAVNIKDSRSSFGTLTSPWYIN